MTQYFQDGGYAMYLTLFTLLGTIGVAGVWRKQASRVLTNGAFLVLAQGLFGLASNLNAVSSQYTRFPDHVQAIGTGIGEAANAGTFAAAVATLLWVASLATAAGAPRLEGAPRAQ